MAAVSTYLNFDGTCEEAFLLYRNVFGGEFTAPIQYMKDVPGGPPLQGDEGDRVMHVALETIAGHQIMGTDIVPSLGHSLTAGNAMSINLEFDDEETLKDVHAKLSEGAAESFGPQAEFWGQLFATVVDRFGIRWMMVAPLEEELGHA